jgi:2',3'-cyclic-nucleotide 2'-phosphodiesterase (5'-nucleotidase family)
VPFPSVCSVYSVVPIAVAVNPIPETPFVPELRLIHTSDFHDRLTPEKAAGLRALKEENQALLIDTGDAIRAPNVTVTPWRDRAISLMNEAGYDAMGLGNREYFFRNRGMAWKTGHATFRRVCTNLRSVRGSLAGIEPWTVLDAPTGARVGLLSLMPTMIAPGHWFERLSDSRFIPWQGAAQEAVAALRERADVLVAGYHRSKTELGEFIATCPEVHVILVGHAHIAPTMPEPGAGGPYLSFVGGAQHARIIGLRSPGGIVTMDRLVDLG